MEWLLAVMNKAQYSPRIPWDPKMRRIILFLSSSEAFQAIAIINYSNDSPE